MYYNKNSRIFQLRFFPFLGTANIQLFSFGIRYGYFFSFFCPQRAFLYQNSLDFEP